MTKKGKSVPGMVGAPSPRRLGTAFHSFVYGRMTKKWKSVPGLVEGAAVPGDARAMPLTQTGRRVVITRLGATPLDTIEHHLVVEAQPAPDPETLAPTDVIVQVKAAAVGWVDLIMASGQYQHVPSPPYTPGLEYAGEVTWVGDAVEHVAIGDRVMADGSLTGPRSLGAHQRWGGFASWAVAPEEALVPLPARLSFEQGAGLLGAYETAYHALIHRGRLRAGETVLVLGASGVTGLAAVQLAKAAGATVIATSRSEEKRADIAAEGADHVIATSVMEGHLRHTVKELTDGAGVDVIYDPVGGEATLEAIRCARFGARFLVVGWAATPFAARGGVSPNVIPTNLVMMKSLDVLGCPAVISAHREPALRDVRRQKVLEWVEAGRLTPRVARSYALGEVREAMRAKWESRFVGVCVLRP